MRLDNLQKQHEIRDVCVERLATRPPYPGYPTERFTGSFEELDEYTIPRGPWSSPSDDGEAVNSNRKRFKKHSLLVDKLGRALHPWAQEIMGSIGFVTGKGAYWHWGPNYTVDPVVITDEETPHVLLVERNDNGSWAFPGGFLDYATESITRAGQRECAEETDVIIGEPVSTIYEGPVADGRTTAHAWAHTTARLWRPTKRQPTTPQLEEVSDAAWFPVDKLPATFHGSHAKILEFALREISS